MTTVVAAGQLFAVNNFGDTRDGGLAGPMALLIILALVGATIFLIRNMNARLRRLPDRFPAEPPKPTQAAAPHPPEAVPPAETGAPGDDEATATAMQADDRP
jgi:hypothetical protein